MTGSPWTAPQVERAWPPYQAADERAGLESWLDFHRQTLLWKCAGLTAEQLRRRAVAPSSLSLLGLVRHMTDVERYWFRRHVDGERIRFAYWARDVEDADFAVDGADDAAAEEAFGAYVAELDIARAVLARHELTDTFVRREADGEHTIDVRWVLVHMIEEYARHNGHADLIREMIDGAVGD